MTVLQEYLMDGLDGFGDDLVDDPLYGTNDIAGIFDEPFEPLYHRQNSISNEPLEKRVKTENASMMLSKEIDSKNVHSIQQQRAALLQEQNHLQQQQHQQQMMNMTTIQTHQLMPGVVQSNHSKLLDTDQYNRHASSISTDLIQEIPILASAEPPTSLNYTEEFTHSPSDQVFAPSHHNAKEASTKKECSTSTTNYNQTMSTVPTSSVQTTSGSRPTKSQEQIDRRRDRNRILARRTRLRKKFFFESLQQQVAELEKENAQLKEIMRTHPLLANEQSLLECDTDQSKINVPPKSVITNERNEATELLTKSDFALMRLVQGAQKSFCITDPSLEDNPIVYASSVFLEQTGYTLDQVVGRNCRFLQGPLTDASTVEKLRDHISRGEDIGVTILNYKKDGTTFWNQLFVAALRDINERIVNFVGIQAPVPGPEPQQNQIISGGGMKHPAEQENYHINNTNSMIPSNSLHDERSSVSRTISTIKQEQSHPISSHIDVLNDLIQKQPLHRAASQYSHSTAPTEDANGLHST
eukprot:CAMPEP_0197287630 /NCGR_PEP_ID=MMETSP0890-20130614/4221_1 /TAXON_ID=44058 ORGANISM="Aureoumbra lagunensis, Strain CCMP1510" /NCGR_SAMPLE_ID=MMETSP0890 /ASSEMBLY_ACC=CAM_ASM_000533 /LENGTH=525 /DNA_ID=CAMNT_0042757553 /DNA_START=129 /DNA_END=1706 /DNA_ORIENTATION=+